MTRIRHRHRPKYQPETRKERDLDRQAHMILTGSPKDFPARPEPEHRAFKSVGSVLQANGRWQALNANNEVLGEFNTRWEAWRLADKLGMEPLDLYPHHPRA